MTIFTRVIERLTQAGAARDSLGAGFGQAGGFTVTEVIIGTTLAAFVMAGVLSAFLMLGRSGYVASTYSDLDAETRRGLMIFGQDARNAQDIHWNGSQSVTLTVPGANGTVAQITYAYDATQGSTTYGSFYRVVGDATSSAPRFVLIHNVGSDFAFHRYKIVQPGVTDNIATSDLETKQLQMTWQAMRSGVTTPMVSQAAASASFILRNKSVAN